MTPAHLIEIRLHLFVLVYADVAWSGNPHLERTHDGDVPAPGTEITLAGESFPVARVLMAERDEIVDVYLDDDLTVAVLESDPPARVLPPYDEHALAARIRDLESHGWTRSYAPHVRTDVPTLDQAT